MSRRARYDYYDPPQHHGVSPMHLRRLMQSECMLSLSLECEVRWRLNLYGLREGWAVFWDGPPFSVSYEEICVEEADCDAVYAKRSTALARVRRALTVGSRPRRA